MNTVPNIVISDATTLLRNMQNSIKVTWNTYVDLFAFKCDPKQSKSCPDNTERRSSLINPNTATTLRFKGESF